MRRPTVQLKIKKSETAPKTMKRMSCSLSNAQLDKINVCTFTQDLKHHCPRRGSLMTYSFAEVANASDLEGSGGLG